MNLAKKISAMCAVILLSACATAPKFTVTDNPDTVKTFDVQTKVTQSRFHGVPITSWVDAKAAMISKSKNCTHFRKISADTAHQYNPWTGTRSQVRSQIFECVDIKNHKNVITSKDTITINDGLNIGNSSRRYNDIKPVLFRHRALIQKISKNENR